MMTQVDELDQDRHMNMTFCEFMEAIVRVAENVAIPHLIDDYYTLGDILDGTVTEDDRAIYAKRSLPEKVEALIYLICAVHLPKNLKAHQATIEKYKKANVYANDIDTGNIRFQ